MGKSQSKDTIPEENDDNCVRFALIGSSGCGKSAFVNAVRGIDEDDDDAASVDIIEREQEPKEYVYPRYSMVSFCDLPGYGTPTYPDVETYWKKLELEKFDRFLIFTSRVTQDDLDAIKKVKLINKPFFLIRTHIDEDAESMTRKKKDQFKEEELLSTIRNDILKWTKLCPKENIFIIDNYDPHKWEFFQLIEAIMNVMPDAEVDTSSDIAEQYMADVRTHIKKNGVTGIEEFLRKKLEGSKSVKICFAITGNTGAGKSAFVNAIRGLNDDDDDAAEVGIVKTTKDPVEYKHPDNPKISFMDLPGIGTPNFPDLQTYCKKVPFEDYDTFLILTEKRFTQNDLDLAKKVKAIGKKFFFVRTHIDEACTPSVDEQAILETIKKDCTGYLKRLVSSEEEIFLISNYNTHKWDFDRLIEAISDALPVRQRECLTLSLTNVTRECLRRKAKFLKAQAVAVATLSAGAGAIPLPAVGGLVDTALIRTTVTAYCRQLGLNNTEESVMMDKKKSEIINNYQSESVVSHFVSVAHSIGLSIGVEEISKFIPFVGTAIA